MLSVIVAANTINDIMDRVCEEHGITRAQYNVLRILRGVHPGGHARCEIACRMLDRASDITRLVDRLQARRLVKRSRGSEDQRQAVTVITAKGMKLLETMRPRIEVEAGDILNKLSDAGLPRAEPAVRHDLRGRAQERGAVVPGLSPVETGSGRSRRRPRRGPEGPTTRPSQN